MKKIILILTTLCLTFAYSFAQNQTGFPTSMNSMIDLLESSAKKKATAGEFSTDSDKLNAKDVFDLNRAMFSAGYTPGLNSAQSSTIQAFFGMPIAGTMYFGLSGVYNMSENRADYFNGTTVGNNQYATIDPSQLKIGTTYKTGSTFAIRPVFKINDMIALHFLIARGSQKSGIQGYTEVDVQNPKNFSAVTNFSDASQWKYEIAAGIKLGEIKLTVPVTINVNGEGTGNFENNYTLTEMETDTYKSKTENASTNRNNGYPINLTVAPEVTIPLQAGPMNSMTFGLLVGGDIYGAETKTYERNITTTTDNNNKSYTYETITEKTQEGVLNMQFDVNAYPTLEWSLAEDKVQLAMEPTIGFKMNIKNVGNVTTKTTTKESEKPNQETTTVSQDKTSTIETTPYIEVPIGTTFKPVEWWEIRAGLKYNLDFVMENYSIETLSGQKGKQFNYDFKSYMNLYTGMGFTVGEDFLIDLFLVAGSEYDDATGNTVQSKNLLDITAWGAQLTYRF